jgi:hypothetical protein
MRTKATNQGIMSSGLAQMTLTTLVGIGGDWGVNELIFSFQTSTYRWLLFQLEKFI